MRVSKPPEERKQEIIDTAMKLFARKGYEATTITDIAKEMNVVSGLCYRYFRSKEDLYHCALEQYAKECTASIIHILNQDYDSLEEYVVQYEQKFRCSDGQEKYHDFFHKDGNQMFHDQLDLYMLEYIRPHFLALMDRLTERKIIQIEHYKQVALFFLYGEMPILNDDSLTTEEKIKIISNIMTKLIQ